MNKEQDNSKKSRWLKTIMIVIIVLALISTIFFKLTPTKAASYTSTQSGNWSDIATWGGVGTPGTGDTVTISAGHTVTLTASATAGTVTIASTGILALGSSGYVLTLDGAVATPLTVTGALTPGTNSTVKYTSVNAGGDVNIATTTYNNLQFAPASAESYNMTGSLTTTNAMTGNITIDANATLKTYVGTTSYNISCVNVTVNTSGVLYAGTADTVGTSVFNVSGNWNHHNGTFTYGQSTVNLTGTGSVVAAYASGTKFFYNLNAAAAGQTTTMGYSIGVGNVLTLGTGILTVGANTWVMNIMGTSTTPFVNAGATITLGLFAFSPTSSGTFTLPGGNYGTIANYLEFNPLGANTVFDFDGDITTTGKLWAVGGNGKTIAINTQNHDLTASGLYFGSAGLTAAVTFSAGSSTINIGASGVLVNSNGGSHFLNLGSSTFNNAGDWASTNGTGAITMDAGSSTVNFTKATGTQALNSGGTAAANTFNNVTHNGAGTLQLITNDLKMIGNFVNSGGTFDTNTKNVTVGGNVNLTTGSYTQGTTMMTLNGSAAQSFTAGGIGAGHTPYNLTVTNASASGVTFADSLTLATGGTFTDSTGDSHLTFNAGSTYTIPNLTMNGTSGHMIVLRSSSATNYWNLNVANAPTVSYVDVSDSDATSATVTTNNSTNSGHNLNWTFNNNTVSGSLYDAIGGSKITAVKTINVSVNGGVADSGTTSSGDYTVTLTSNLNANDIVTVFVSGDIVKASTVTKVNNTGDITGINLFQNYTTTRNETGISQLTNTDLATADNLADIDILFSVGGGNAVTFTQGVYIPATFTYNPTGDITTPGNWNGTGTFTASSYQVVFSGAGTQTLDSGGTGTGHLFNGLTHDGAGTLQLLTNNLDVDGNFVNSAGIFDINGKDILAAGNVDLTGGSFTQGTRTITLDGAVGQSFTAGGTGTGHTPYNLTVTNTSASGVTFADSLTLASGGTFTDSTGESNLTFNAGSTYTVPTLIMDGTVGHNITLRSSNPGTYWNLNVSNAPTLTYVDAQDSDAHTGAAIFVNMSIIDSQHNVNWTSSWYNSSWLYRKAITIDNTAGGALTDYQVKVTLNNTNFDFSKAKTDGSDIRFTDSDETTLISHWTESYDSIGQTATIWPKVPSIPASSSKIIYMYYGNSAAAPYDYFKLSVNSTAHNDYGLAYPVTYEFSIPAGSSGLKVYKKYTEVQAWTQITEKTSSDFFNGIEAVRFDYPANKAYISVAYSDTSDDIRLRITNTSDQLVDMVYQGISKYYDNRKAAAVFTADDWSDGSNTSFKQASDAFTSRSIWLTPAIITGWTTAPTWADIQSKINAGYIEPASHSRTHINVPYGDYDSEIGGSKSDILNNLDMPILNKKGSSEYLYAWTAPFGGSDATLRSKLGQYKYLEDTAGLLGDHTTTFTDWDYSNGLYGKWERWGYAEDQTEAAMNSKWDVDYAAGLIYHLGMHPSSLDWSAGSKINNHLDYIKGKKDVWYAGIGNLLLYHYIDDSPSPEFSITVSSEVPLTASTVTVQMADGITASSAVLHGTITDTGTTNSGTRGFKYYQSADCSGTENDRSENGDFGAEAYSLNLTGITSNTLFSYKAYATSPAGTGTSSACEAFTTLPNAPTVIVQAAPALAQTTATLNGNITAVDGVNATERGFNVYNGAVCAGGSIQNPKDTGGSYGVDVFSKGATGLTSNTVYSYTVYAINTGGTGISGCQSFTTLPNAPTVTVQVASALAQTTATLNGNITAVDGTNATERGFDVYNGAICAGGSIQNPKDTGGSYSAGAFSKGATSLTLNTAYSYTAYAINTGGTGTSGCQSFVTLVNIPDSPTVNYNTDTSLTIIINPNLNSAGTLFAIQNVTASQYVKADGTLQAGEIWQTRAAWGGDSGIINVGLSANTQYTYKVKAKNSADVETALSEGVAKYTGASNPGTTIVTALSSDSIKVDWTSGGAQNKFNVYRNGQSGAGTLVHSANDLTYTDDGLTASTTYTYYVYSVNEDGVENTNFASATVSTPAVTVPPVVTPTPTPSPSVTTAPSSEESAIPQNTNTAKVDYTSPTANFSISQEPSTFVTGEPISFDASGSTDDIKVTKYEWDFGDGETSDIVKVNHSYEKPGRYTVTLTVYDKEGNKGVATQTIDIKPSIPTISNITAKGTNLFIEGKSDPDTIIYFTIHSETFNGQGIADKHGYWTYNLENASDIIGQGSHTIFALAAVKLADNSEIRGAESKTYDFNLTVDNGKLKVEMKKTKIWQYISLGLILLIVVGFVLRRFRKGKLINR